MKVLIVEDETAAMQNLTKILEEVDPTIEIVGNTESVFQTIKWMTSHEDPDLIFMDIHLSDGSAFNIFRAITVETPIVFTTAYDEYAINAFKVNSIDYLLKPICSEDLNNALIKFKKLKKTHKYNTHLSNLISSGNEYAEKILVTTIDELLTIQLNSVSFFYNTNRESIVMLKDNKSYPYSKWLNDIYCSLDKTKFIRANKQFIIAKDSIKKVVLCHDRRLLVILNTNTPEPIYIPKNKVASFKQWMIKN